VHVVSFVGVAWNRITIVDPARANWQAFGWAANVRSSAVVIVARLRGHVRALDVHARPLGNYALVQIARPQNRVEVVEPPRLVFRPRVAVDAGVHFEADGARRRTGAVARESPIKTTRGGSVAAVHVLVGALERADVLGLRVFAPAAHARKLLPQHGFFRSGRRHLRVGALGGFVQHATHVQWGAHAVGLAQVAQGARPPVAALWAQVQVLVFG